MRKRETLCRPDLRLQVCWVTFLIVIVFLATPIDASHLQIVAPINKWINTITGPVALGLGILIFVGLGVAMGAGKIDFTQLAITGLVTVAVLGLIFFARPLIHQLFGASVTPSGALLGF